MARFGRWRPLGPDWDRQPLLTPDVVVLHTMVASLGQTDAMFHDNGYGGIFSHFGVGADGEVVQWQDTEHRAAANYAGNHRVISIETADRGAPFPAWDTRVDAVPRWTEQQLDALAELIARLCVVHDIPCALIPDSKPGRRGIGYHRQGCDGNYPDGRVPGGELWSTKMGKVCLPTDSTEVLTDHGWLPILAVDSSHRVASWSPDSGSVSFDQARRVEPFEAHTVTVGDFESTPDHEWVVLDPSADVRCSCGYEGAPRGVRNHAGHGTSRGETHIVQRTAAWKKVPADQVVLCDAPNVVQWQASGLDLTLDQVRLMAWYQADGHAMIEKRGSTPTVIGVEWHIRKRRKIDRLTALLGRLGIDHVVRERADGTTVARVYGDEARDKVIALLPEKSFTWDLLDMSSEQVDALWAEAVFTDGDATSGDEIVFSTDIRSMDVLQALGTLNGRAVTSWDSNGLRWLRVRRRPRKLRPAVAARTTEVACLTTVNGTLVIRQHGRVIVTGNCPGNARIAQIPVVISRARALLTIPPIPTPAPPCADDQEDEMFIRCKFDPAKPASVALLSGPMFVNLVGAAVASAEAAIAKGATVLDVGPATWGDLDRRSHNLTDSPRIVTVAPGAP